MRCPEIEKLILLQDAGKLSAARAEKLAAHLLGCADCRDFQQALRAVRTVPDVLEEPGAAVVNNVLREARCRAPQSRRVVHFGLKPALAMAASLVIALGLFLTANQPGKVGLELEVTARQLMDSEDQIVDVMYGGLSEDDLVFNFAMTFDEG